MPLPKQAQTNNSRSWLKISRPEFLPANSASLIIGFAWGLTLPIINLLGEFIVPLFLAFAVITLVGAYAAHVNTMADFELDQTDSTKNDLVKAMATVGKSNLKKVMAIELVLSLVFLLALTFMENKLIFTFMWAAAAFLAYAYSSEPLRFKSRSLASPVTLMIVLSILPVSFVTLVFTSSPDWYFWVFLSGQALTVYGVIVPAEIRDYFTDKASGAKTMTVKVGLVKASGVGVILLAIGGILCAVGFAMKFMTTALPLLGISLVIMGAAYIYVLSKYLKLLTFSKQLENPQDGLVEQRIVDLAALNPKWITMVTQTILLVSIVLLVAKLL